ncbi:hypothetical protein F2Q70_00042692 [Brassica cretica]|uniref:Uncharacterized protein n=1 Tax=Brassica cretica TaxID=69181 RepID=A0A8S9LKE0_BRACR|nr:hypothetical protein F2Q70_00042692 [Brassica cretica]KAF2606457.1 hypothetical protein F2Q68_00043514 [Brassica cretica]
MKIPKNISSELPRIGPSESPSKYHEEVLPRYIPRTFPTNWWYSEFPRKFISSEFRLKFPRDFRGNMNFRGVISEDLFRRSDHPHAAPSTLRSRGNPCREESEPVDPQTKRTPPNTSIQTLEVSIADLQFPNSPPSSSRATTVD